MSGNTETIETNGRIWKLDSDMDISAAGGQDLYLASEHDGIRAAVFQGDNGAWYVSAWLLDSANPRQLCSWVQHTNVWEAMRFAEDKCREAAEQQVAEDKAAIEAVLQRLLGKAESKEGKGAAAAVEPAPEELGRPMPIKLDWFLENPRSLRHTVRFACFNLSTELQIYGRWRLSIWKAGAGKLVFESDYMTADLAFEAAEKWLSERFSVVPLENC